MDLEPRDDRGTAGKLYKALSALVASVAIIIAVAAFALSGAFDIPAVPSTPADATSTPTPSAEESSTVGGPVDPIEPVVEDADYSGRIVVIDAGHQGRGNPDLEPIGPGSTEMKAKVTSGTGGRTTGVAEHIVNLQVALKLKELLVEEGVQVVMVRETADVDISNSQRAIIGNEAGADIVVRIHCDGATDSLLRGFLTLVPAQNEWTGPIVEPSRIAGDIIHKNTLRTTGANDRGVKAVGNMTGFNWSTVPSVIVEMGLMTNPEDDRLLVSDDYQNKLAQGMADGVFEYLRTLPR